MIAHYALHELRMLPSQYLALLREEKAFVIGSIKVKIEDDKKKTAEMKRGGERRK